MWQDFTNIYSLSKTLRFELVPTEKTKSQLKSAAIIETDEKRHKNFKQLKKALDEVHRRFIADSLENLQLETSQLKDFAELALSQGIKQDKNKQIELSKTKKSIYAIFSSSFSIRQKIWEEKYGQSKFITSPEAQLCLLENFMPEISERLGLTENELADLRQQFDKFSSYFQGYKKNRENVYSINGNATEIVHRTIDQNLLKYYKNIQKYEKYYKDKLLPSNATEYFDIKNYSSYMSQDGIDRYNEAVGEFRSRINQARQGVSKQEKKALPMFETLFKQILGDGTKKVLFEKLENEEEYDQLVKKLQQDLPQHIAAISDHAQKYLKSPSNTEAIWLNSRAVNALLYKHISSPELARNYLPKEFISNRNAKDETARQNSFLSLRQLFEAIDQAQQDAGQQNILKTGARTDKPSVVAWDVFCEDVDGLILGAKQSIEKLGTSSMTNKETLKKALDSFNDVYRVYSYFEPRYKNEPVTSLEIDPDFYDLFEDPDDQDSYADIGAHCNRAVFVTAPQTLQHGFQLWRRQRMVP